MSHSIGVNTKNVELNYEARFKLKKTFKRLWKFRRNQRLFIKLVIAVNIVYNLDDRLNGIVVTSLKKAFSESCSAVCWILMKQFYYIILKKMF